MTTYMEVYAMIYERDMTLEAFGEWYNERMSEYFTDGAQAGFNDGYQEGYAAYITMNSKEEDY